MCWESRMLEMRLCFPRHREAIRISIYPRDRTVLVPIIVYRIRMAEQPGLSELNDKNLIQGYDTIKLPRAIAYSHVRHAVQSSSHDRFPVGCIILGATKKSDQEPQKNAHSTNHITKR